MVICQILENLYIGNLSDVKQTSDLVTKQIKCILTVDQSPLLSNFRNDCCYKHIILLDIESEDILTTVIADCNDYIESARSQEQAVVVHCNAGQSRSGAIVLAYLMWKLTLTYDEALELAKKLKSDIRLNEGFVKQLKLYEEMNYKVDKMHPLYRRYSLNRVAQLISAGHDISQMEFTNEESSDSDIIYKCKKCRRLLFKQTHILTHPAGAGQLVFAQPWRDHMTLDAQCEQSLFIEPVKWMSDQNIHEMQGKLLCPNCPSKIGSWNWTGERCSCGNWVTPSFHIDKKKVDRRIPVELPKH